MTTSSDLAENPRAGSGREPRHDAAPDYPSAGGVGASATEAATALPPLKLPRLSGRTLPLTAPARIYVCGITPYDVTHLGHAATFVWADTLARVLQLLDVPVVTARNVTDVDDVLTAAAARGGADYASFGLVQEHHFDQDMRALSVRTPTHAPRARHHVDHVQRLAATLLALDHAYERDGTVYFRGGTVPREHGLGRDEALALLSEYGDDPSDPLREDPFDVPVWRRSELADPAWPSPWGPGRPGWHAECSAMALATLGGLVDVVVGGADLAFPHHAYQHAIAAAATGGRFQRTAMHVGTVRYQGRKMAKSTGNLVLVNDLLARAPAPVLRLMLLDRGWSAPWDFDESLIDEARARLDDLFVAAGSTSRSSAREPSGDRIDPSSAVVIDALIDDLDVPAALRLAIAEGGDAARLLLRALGLT